MTTAHRAALLALFAAVVATGGIVDHVVSRGAAGAAPEAAPSQLAGAGAESTSWYCPSGTGAKGGAPATVLLTNATDRPVSGTLTAVPSAGPAKQVPITVPAGGEASVVPSQVVEAATVAATVALDGGGVGVSESVAGPLGWADAPCASSTAMSWTFAHASTANATTTLTLFNPTSTTAVADVTLVTSRSGTLQPSQYQEMSLAPGSVTAVNLGDHALDDPAVATKVTALSGAVVAGELQQSSAPGADGLSLLLGSTPASRWAFPQTTQVPGGTVVFDVFDPGRRPATVTASLELQQGTAEPFTVHVPAGGTATLTLSGQTRVPVGAAFGVRLAAAHGVKVVVSRQVTAPVSAPKPHLGETAGTAGAGSRRWLVPAVPPPGTGPSSLAVLDLAGKAVSVTVSTVVAGHPTPVAGLLHRTLQPGALLLAGPAVRPPATALLVTASGPVAVELDPLPASAPGVVVVPALPGG